jgi:hypothetical protein
MAARGWASGEEGTVRAFGNHLLIVIIWKKVGRHEITQSAKGIAHPPAQFLLLRRTGRAWDILLRRACETTEDK